MSSKKVIIIFLLADATALAYAILLTPDNSFMDGGFISIYSFFKLMIIASCTWEIFKLRQKIEAKANLLWAFISTFVFFLAIDEMLGLSKQLISTLDFSNSDADFIMLMQSLKIGLQAMFLSVFIDYKERYIKV